MNRDFVIRLLSYGLAVPLVAFMCLGSLYFNYVDGIEDVDVKDADEQDVDATSASNGIDPE